MGQNPEPLPLHPRNLGVLAYANGFTLWHFNLAHVPLGLIEGVGALDPVADMLADGDLLTIACASGLAIRSVHKHGSTIVLRRTI